MDSTFVSNKNFGAGRQESLAQVGGSNNVQYNADIINYHGDRVQEPTRTSPPPSSTVPFHRDPNFVDRTELEMLEEKLSVWNKKVALVGIGGVGKSQLAIEFCYRIRDKSPEIWTFWVHAGSAARFDADIRKLACDAGIPGWNDPKSDAFTLVYSWLRDERNGEWILVLDNVDDASFLFEKPDGNDESARIRIAYLPPCEHGSTLITSRSWAATARLTDECDTIVVNHMGEVAALALLEKRLGQSAAAEDMQKLAGALGHMPLALAQAAAYIKRRGSRCSVGRYLAELEESEKSQTSLLSSASHELRRDTEAQDSIISTWQISFKHIHDERPSAADLLSLMSMYNHQGIPEYLLRAERSVTNKDFEEDILILEDFLFVTSTISSNISFEMHRLVQLAAPSLYLQDLGIHFPRTSTLDGDDREVSLLDSRQDLRSLGEFFEALSYENSAALLGMEDKQTLSALDLYGRALSEQGKYEAAEDKIRQALRGRERVLGNEHPDTLRSVDSLASVLANQGKYEAAEEASRRALEAREKVLGKEHLDTIESVRTLASLLANQNKYEAAEEASQRALKGREKVLGMEHLNTVISVLDLAGLALRRGRRAEVVPLYKRIVVGFGTCFGVQHPFTLQCQDNLVELQRRCQIEEEKQGRRGARSGSEKQSQQGPR
ncbi:hypothetical protein KC330_g8557 [Hortaea werneckii]|nr:hypothetical protein KC330_g8557 [Hortaea werneckii]